MFLHIGGNVVVPMSSVIAIFDMDTATTSKDSKEFIRIAEEEGFISTIAEDLPKTFVITEINKKSKIYLTPISSITLLRRLEGMKNISRKIRIKKGVSPDNEKAKLWWITNTSFRRPRSC